MLTNRALLHIAKVQSAIDLHCSPEDFDRAENILVRSEKHPDARRYLELPFACNLVSYGTNIVASVQGAYRELVAAYLEKTDVAHCMETPGIYALNSAFAPFDMQVCFMAEYFLPDLGRLAALPCSYEMRLLTQGDLGEDFYAGQWPNALCRERRALDVLAVAALDKGEIVALAGCSADCADMWQIGIDVQPPYRRQGVAAALTSRLALEILARGKVPFYCCAWCNIKSARNAVRSGFAPAWAELTVKSREFIAKMQG